MTKQQLRESWADVELELRTLTRCFDLSPTGRVALARFEEYVSHNELGFALETLCDFLLESDGSISSDLLVRIEGPSGAGAFQTAVNGLRTLTPAVVEPSARSSVYKTDTFANRAA
jgi:hypothetical protein